MLRSGLLIAMSDNADTTPIETTTAFSIKRYKLASVPRTTAAVLRLFREYRAIIIEKSCRKIVILNTQFILGQYILLWLDVLFINNDTSG